MTKDAHSPEDLLISSCDGKWLLCFHPGVFDDCFQAWPIVRENGIDEHDKDSRNQECSGLSFDDCKRQGSSTTGELRPPAKPVSPLNRKPSLMALQEAGQLYQRWIMFSSPNLRALWIIRQGCWPWNRSESYARTWVAVPNWGILSSSRGCLGGSFTSKERNQRESRQRPEEVLPFWPPGSSMCTSVSCTFAIRSGYFGEGSLFHFSWIYVCVMISYGGVYCNSLFGLKEEKKNGGQ